MQKVFYSLSFYSLRGRMRKYALKVGIMTYMVGNGRPDQSVLMHRLIRAIVAHNEVVLTSNHNLSL